MGLANSPTSGASADGLLKLEDAVAASGDAGVGILLKRTDTAATQTSATGDYTLPVANLNGAQLIDINRTFQASDPNGLLKAEDAAFSSGDAVVMVGSQYLSTPAQGAGTTGDVSVLTTGATGGLYADLDARAQGAGTSPVRREDAAFADQDGVIMVGAVNNRGLTAFNATQGDCTPVVVDDYGRQINIPFSSIDNYLYGNIAPTTATNTSLIAAQGGSLRTYLTNLSISNTGSTTSLISITDGSGGAVLWYTIAPAGGGSNIQFTVPIRTSANTALFVTTGSASTTMYISGSGFKAL